MSEVQIAIYLGIIFLYCFFYYIAMKERKEDAVHNFLSVVIFILAIASIVWPLCFAKLWKLVALVSVSLIVATVFTDDSQPNTPSDHDALGPWPPSGGLFLYWNLFLKCLLYFYLLSFFVMYKKIISDLENLKNPAKAKILSGFFKTGKGEYGEGDKFLGIPVPEQREIAKKIFMDSSFDDIDKLMKSEYHEVRLTGFLILCYKYEFAAKKKNVYLQKEIVDFYLSHLEYGNNRDLVDLVCYKILGHYLLDNDRSILYDLAKDENMWKQRVGIVSTMIFVRKGDFDDALKISKILLNHDHDLLHKAVGRVLREIGKKDEKVLKKFLDVNVKDMDRTTLRYAIEKFDEKTRKFYLNLN